MLKVKVKSLSRVRFFATPWTLAHQTPPSMGFYRQEYWSGLPFPSPGDLPNPGIEPRSPTLQADSLPAEPPGKPISYINSTYRDSLALEFMKIIHKFTFMKMNPYSVVRIMGNLCKFNIASKTTEGSSFVSKTNHSIS